MPNEFRRKISHRYPWLGRSYQNRHSTCDLQSVAGLYGGNGDTISGQIDFPNLAYVAVYNLKKRR